MVDQAGPGLYAPLDAKDDNRAKPARQVFLSVGARRVILESRINHPLHGWMLSQMPGYRHRIAAMTLHPQAEGLNSHQEQKGVKWAHARTDIPQVPGAQTCAERQSAKFIMKLDAVVRRVGLGVLGESPATPVKAASVDDHPSD